jgi:chromosome segregation ATPase
VLSDQQQNLTALSDRLSSIKQTIDDAAVRELDIKNSIEAIGSRVLNAQTRLDELLPRLALGDKAREDQGTLIGLFVARLKKLNATLTDVAQRLSDLENSFRSKARQPEDHHGSILEHADCPSTNKMEAPVKDVNAADGVLPIEAKADGENAEALESQPQDKESSNEASVEREGRSADNSRADQHAT